MSTSDRCVRRLLAALLGVLLALAAGWSAADAGTAVQSRWLPPGTAPALGQSLPRALPGLPLIFPDGEGLPAGRGSAAEGGVLYQGLCASCHGRNGEGNSAPELIGGDGPLSRPDADKTIATYWPYATTLFDTIRRGMPPDAPERLSDTQIYALCAWILARNGLWTAERPLDAAGLASIRMPNRDGFVSALPR